MERQKLTLSLVIPAYNEEKIIFTNLKKVLSYLKKKKFASEVIVVNDGSKDNTERIIKKNFGNNLKLISFKENKGKGAALKEGILSSKGKFVIFMDADLSVPLKNIDSFLKVLKKGKDVVIASRRLKGSKIIVHQPFFREKMGQFHTFLSKLFVGVKVSDFTCGFKGFTDKSAKKIFKNSKINRWAYDDEIIYLAKKYNFKIQEMPVEWINRKDTRVKIVSVVFETLRDLLKIRINDLIGVYEKN